MIQIIVRFHAGAREAAGVSEYRLDLSEDETIAQLKDHLAVEFPAIDRYRNTLLFAIREEYVAGSHRLANGDVVSCFPPVSGG